MTIEGTQLVVGTVSDAATACVSAPWASNDGSVEMPMVVGVVSSGGGALTVSRVRSGWFSQANKLNANAANNNLLLIFIFLRLLPRIWLLMNETIPCRITRYQLAFPPD
jgi:hypothetical protein